MMGPANTLIQLSWDDFGLLYLCFCYWNFIFSLYEAKSRGPLLSAKFHFGLLLDFQPTFLQFSTLIQILKVYNVKLWNNPNIFLHIYPNPHFSLSLSLGWGWPKNHINQSLIIIKYNTHRLVWGIVQKWKCFPWGASWTFLKAVISR